MPTTPVKTPRCKCCRAEIVVPPTQSGPSIDKDLGPVCEDCKAQLRWAQAHLKTSKIEGVIKTAPDGE